MLSFKKPNTPEWHAMWAWLAAHPWNDGFINPTVAECPHTGEVWQYMGTHDGYDEFRHRRHPRFGRRVALRRPVR